MMTAHSSNNELHEWERELLAVHRWGRIRKWFPEHIDWWEDERIAHEHAHLNNLWEKAQPLDKQSEDILRAIMALEICNWNLEESILALCRAIGSKEAPHLRIGHSSSITDERWRKVWAYYLTLKNWLPNSGRSTGYDTLLSCCDPEGEIREHVLGMLGGSTEVKRLYVERICLNLEYWLGGFYPEGSPQLGTYNAAVEALEKEIAKLDPDPEMLEWMRLDGKRGWIEVCHHKAFRRFDIHISSIGAGGWRGAVPHGSASGLDRAETLEGYLSAIEAWTKGSRVSENPPDDVLSQEILDLLGEPDDTKLFLTSLLVSLLRSQQIAARRRAEKRLKL